MSQCWSENPADRPTFTQIRERLETMMTQDNPYEDLNDLEESGDEFVCCQNNEEGEMTTSL